MKFWNWGPTTNWHNTESLNKNSFPGTKRSNGVFLNCERISQGRTSSSGRRTSLLKKWGELKGSVSHFRSRLKIWVRTERWAKANRNRSVWHCHRVLHMQERRSVWPDGGIKSCPISPKVSSKVAVSFFNLKDRISKWPKELSNFWATFVRESVTKTFQKHSNLVTLIEV